MAPPRRAKQFDPVSMEFPTDSITFEQIRRHEPESVRWHSPPDPPRLLEIVAVHRFEQLIAEKAYCGAIGLDDPYPHFSRDDLTEGVCDGYRSLGISKDDRAARQLVARLEEDARRQALAMGSATGRKR